jgi:hypothetical protein
MDSARFFNPARSTIGGGNQASGFVLRSPVTRSPGFHSPRFLSNSTRSKRFKTLRFAPRVEAARRLRCCDIKLIGSIPPFAGKADGVCSTASTECKTLFSSETGRAGLAGWTQGSEHHGAGTASSPQNSVLLRPYGAGAVPTPFRIHPAERAGKTAKNRLEVESEE